MLIFYFIILALFSIYSYSLIDPNLTLFSNQLWELFRNNIIYLGYYQRSISSYIFLSFIVLLFFFHFYLVKNSKKFRPLKLALGVGLILIFSYPFLSHDFFNYMFDAKIVTFYGANPYIKKALDFPGDPWLRFMHWTHRTYPYGPVFLPLTLLPSFLSLGKLVMNFFLFKLLFAAFYFTAVYFLSKINSRWAVIFATQPLILVEGLINSHNDMVALSLAVIGIYFLFKKKIWARWFLFFSAGIKYMTGPLLFLSKNKKSKINILVVILIISVLIYFSFWQEIQPWYYLAAFAFLPFYEQLIIRLNIFFAGLLFSYYPYIAFDFWNNLENIEMKHFIILVFFVINLLLLLIQYNFIKNGSIFKKLRVEA